MILKFSLAFCYPDALINVVTPAERVDRLHSREGIFVIQGT